MNITMRQGRANDLDELERLYDDLNDHLTATTNYPGWRKGDYPTRRDAVKGIKEGSLYVALCDNSVAGSIILRHLPEKAYLPVTWLAELNYEEIFVIHTFAVHPSHGGQGIGKTMLDFAEAEGVANGVKSLRLDVYENNLPAIHLYEKCGFKYVDKVDLGLRKYGLDWFSLYEKLL